MAKHQRAVAKMVRAHPDVEASVAFVMGGNSGFFFARMKPRDQRALSVDQIIDDLRPKVARFPAS